jgi:O-antigen/teichoic acid export membrane protein
MLTPISTKTAAPFERFCKGMASTFLGQIIVAASPLILVPLFLRAWGGERYGWWLSLTAWASLLKLMDLGGQSFIGNVLAQDYVQGDMAAFRQKLAEGVSLFVVLCAAVFSLLALVLAIPGLHTPGTGRPLGLEARLVLLIMGGWSLVGISGGVYVTIFRATGLYYMGSMIGNIYRSIFFLVCAGLLLAYAIPLVYASAQLTLEISGTIIIVCYTLRRLPEWSRIRLSLSSAWAGRVYLKGSFYFWLIALAYMLNFQGTIIVISAFGSGVMVAVFATHRTVSGLVGYVGTLFQGPLWPELTFLKAQGQEEKLRRLSLLTIRTVVFLSGAAALFLWLFFPLIYPLWTGRHLEIQPALMLLLLCQAVLAAGWNTAGWSLLAANRHRGLALFSLANALLTILLAVVLAPRFGILGVAGASLAGDLVFGLSFYPALLARFLKIPITTVFRTIWQPALALVIPGAFLVWGASLLPSWQVFLAAATAAILLGYPVAMLAIGRDELIWLIGHLKGWAKGCA